MTTRERLDEYLDGALDDAGRREIEALVAADPSAARLLSAMKSERALRNAAYASFNPTEYETSTLAHEVIAACEDEAAHPIGHIGALVWTRRIAGVAAAIIIAAGAFAAGRASAPVTVGPTASNTAFEAPLIDADGAPVFDAYGTPLTRKFGDRAEFVSYFRDQVERRNAGKNPANDFIMQNTRSHHF